MGTSLIEVDDYLVEVDDEDIGPQVYMCTDSIVLVSPDGHFEGIIDCVWAGVRADLERGHTQCPECGSEEVVPVFVPV